MKKKGFTLIELLAVIVILAIIALIAIPLIGNVIEKAKIGALENSVNGLVESANMYYANQTIKGEQNVETTFDFAEGVQTSDSKLEYKGKVYNGKLILHANGETAICIDDKEHYAYKNKDTDEIVSGIGTCLYDGTTGDFSSNSPLEDMKKQVAAATATSDKVLEGSTIYTSNGLVAGTMPNNATDGYYYSGTNVGFADGNVNFRFPKGAYLTANETGYVEAWTEASNLGITADKIAAGQTVAGITGTFKGNMANFTKSLLKTVYVSISVSGTGNLRINRSGSTSFIYTGDDADYLTTNNFQVQAAGGDAATIGNSWCIMGSSISYDPATHKVTVSISTDGVHVYDTDYTWTVTPSANVYIIH